MPVQRMHGNTDRILCATQRVQKTFVILQVQFDWRIFPRHTTTTILQEIKKMMAEKGTSPLELQGRITFMMINDIEVEKENESNCSQSAVEVASYAR